jgi:hypothetical protein
MKVQWKKQSGPLLVSSCNLVQPKRGVGEVHDHFVASGQIKLRRIDGWQKIAAVVSRQRWVAA